MPSTITGWQTGRWW